ncbi:MAG: hypothetical protein Q8R00_03050 [Candidatus Nanoarchaeia archaeon]|nr:hypothetical protein [Candidatus Nanoarchaeia archaeon]
MGTQGEIYNVLGLKLSAEVVEEDKLYRVNGKLISTVGEIPKFGADLVHGSVKGTADVDLENPLLGIWLMGYGGYNKGRHFENEALVGYTVANESYINFAKKLPSFEILESLKPKLLEDIKTKLNFDAELNQLELYLLFDWINGFDY